MERQPLTKQRSMWALTGTMEIAGVTATAFRRAVTDGTLTAIVSDEPEGWHLSISHAFSGNHPVPAGRYPTWDEIAHARDELLPANLAFVMHLPTADEYVAVHDTCFHIHELVE